MNLEKIFIRINYLPETRKYHRIDPSDASKGVSPKRIQRHETISQVNKAKARFSQQRTVRAIVVIAGIVSANVV